MEMLGQVPGETLTSAKITHIEVHLKAFKGTAEAIQASVEDQILIQVAETFGAPSHLDVDIQETFKNWYNGLSSTQKDPFGTYHNNDSKPLVKFTAYANIRELLFKTLPEAYSLGSVDTWMSNFVSTMVQRIQSGKNHIETNAPQISQLKVDFINALSQHGNQVTYQGELVLHLDTEDGQGIIYCTEDGSDPTTSKQRQRLNPGDTLIIKGNRKIKLVVADQKGNFSAVKTIEAIDELEKYKVVRPAQKTAFDETITFVFPKSKEAASIVILSMLSELVKSGLYTDSDFRQAVLRALDEIEK